MGDNDSAAAGDRRSGIYLGTEVDGRWWKGHLRDGFFLRGNGECWLEGDAVKFRRLLIKEPLSIPFAAITGVRTGKWHAGKWLAGKPIVKIGWRDAEGRSLTSGIGFARREDADLLLRELNIRGSKLPAEQ